MIARTGERKKFKSKVDTKKDVNTDRELGGGARNARAKQNKTKKVI